MKITLTRKTSAWGALRYFTFYKNGVHQGKLFTNVPIEIEADPGDVLTFYEGWFQFYRHSIHHRRSPDLCAVQCDWPHAQRADRKSVV